MANIALVTSSTAGVRDNNRTALESLGHTVTVVPDSTITTADFSSYDLIVCAWPTYANRAVIAAELRAEIDAGTPLLISIRNNGQVTSSFQNGVTSELRLTSRSLNQNASGSNYDDIQVTNTTHPITAGLALGKLNIATGGNGHGWLIRNTGGTDPLVGTILADSDPDPGTSDSQQGRSLLAVDSGTLDLDGVPVNARVVVYGALDAGNNVYSTDGLDLIDRILDWLLVSGPTPAIDVPVRSGIVTGSRIAVSVDRTTAIRSGIVAGSRISIATESRQPVPIRSGIVSGSRISIMAVSPSDRLVAARSGVVAGSRISVRVDVPVHIRAGVIVGSRPGVAIIADGAVVLRSGVIVGSRIHIQQEVRVAIRAGIIVGARQAVQLHRNVAIRSGVIVGARDGYTGPGTGIVVPGQRFSQNSLREGDTFTVFLPWAGLQGMSGLAHVMSRTASDERSDQDVELAISPHDVANVPRLAGGATPTPAADSTDFARQQSRQGRELDRIERSRR